MKERKLKLVFSFQRIINVHKEGHKPIGCYRNIGYNVWIKNERISSRVLLIIPKKCVAML